MIFKKRYPYLSFAENFLGGHITIGPVTIYGENAMHWAIEVNMGKDYLLLRLPLRCFGVWWPLYCFRSPDGTPTRATWWGWGRKTRGF